MIPGPDTCTPAQTREGTGQIRPCGVFEVFKGVHGE